MTELPFAAALRGFISGWLQAGKQVAAPVEAGGRLLYRRLTSAEQAVFGANQKPANSIKEFFLPRHERLFGYRNQGNSVELADIAQESREQIVLSMRPCDTRALPILDRVFEWGGADEFYARARARTIIVTLACSWHDDACFCTSLGSGPCDETGSDAMLYDAGDGTFQIRLVQDRARDLFAGRVPPPDLADAPAGPPVRFDTARIRTFLTGGFDKPFWKEDTLACIGCGACAYTCPTCHCFDIVDEGNARGGARVRNWDSCQFSLFTLHASGHNPRPAQPERQRQRIYHKFQIYPDKFGLTLCTGCGNCVRNCPVGMGVLGVLQEIHERERVQA